MPGASRRVRRLEKDALLRSKNTEYTREQSDNYISSLQLNYDDDETERHRRHVSTRPIRQIQREADYPVESLEKITERIQQEIKRRHMSVPATGNHFQSSSTPDRTTRDSEATGKYSSNKHTSNTKLH
ncbi:unnamed protein product [Adineta steineri]|uniref:Uncharacterized protein n=1 Tax=Adineta steineri TaxID=433720 RepID=A0A815E3F1_9BILA|nr:unnamed protein product [Adineta steineri]CAF1365435.1 unnamed protein product [Adineta steineri]CAF1380882.1 unnamed protein product [Adineta steineri]CAF1382298.1 unnamed protein product [Adineta steineri]CAF1608001.1 unnamed protein product [Adineta steineri]